MVTWTTGTVGSYALSFNGNPGDQARFSSTAMNSSWTVSYWAKYNVTTGDQVIIGGSGTYIGYTDGTYYRVCDNPQVRSWAYVPDTNWHHYLVTRKNEGAFNFTCELWIDGVSQGTNFTGSGNQTYLSSFGYYSSYQLNGNLDEVRFYNVVLSSGDIATLAAKGDVTTNLINKWDMEEGSGIYAYDHISSNTATLSTGFANSFSDTFYLNATYRLNKYYQILLDTIKLTDIFDKSKGAIRIFTEGIKLTDYFISPPLKYLYEQIKLTASPDKFTTKLISNQLNLLDIYRTSSSYASLSEQVNLNDLVRKRSERMILDTLNLSETITKDIEKNLILEYFRLNDTYVKNWAYRTTLTDILYLSETIRRNLFKQVLLDSIYLSEAINKGFPYPITENIILTDSPLKDTTRNLIDTLNLNDVVRKSSENVWLYEQMNLDDWLFPGWYLRTFTEGLILNDVAQINWLVLTESVLINDVILKDIFLRSLAESILISSTDNYLIPDFDYNVMLSAEHILPKMLKTLNS